MRNIEKVTEVASEQQPPFEAQPNGEDPAPPASPPPASPLSSPPSARPSIAITAASLRMDPNAETASVR